MTRMLLIDDDPGDLLRQINHIFGPQQIEVSVGYSGEDGLKQVAEQRPTWSCWTSSFPTWRVWRCTSRIRSIDARIPVIFITATTATETAIEAMRQGALRLPL